MDSLTCATDLAALATLKEYAITTKTWVLAVAAAHAAHNVGEIERVQADLVDLVLRLERPDMNDRDSPRAGQADIHVSRSRTSPTSTMTVAFQGHYGRFVDMSA